MIGAREDVGSPEQVRTLLALLDKIATERSWEKDAACRGLTHMFFPANGQEKLAQHAKAVCEGCPVRRECARASGDELYGVWAGTTVEERRRERRREEDR